MSPQVCTYPGCPMVVTRGDRCRRHPTLRRKTRGSVALNKRPNSRTWSKLREAALKRDGYRCCAELPNGERCPIEDRTGRSLKEHHIIGLKEGGPNVLGNLVTLCKPHHDQVEREKRRAAAKAAA